MYIVQLLINWLTEKAFIGFKMREKKRLTSFSDASAAVPKIRQLFHLNSWRMAIYHIDVETIFSIHWKFQINIFFHVECSDKWVTFWYSSKRRMD